MTEKTTQLSQKPSLSGHHQGNPLGRNLLLKSASLIVVARIFGAGFAILTQIVLAVLLDAHEIGLFFVATGLASVLAVIGTLGYPMLVPRIAAQAASENNPDLLAGFMARARTDTLFISGLLICLLLLFVWLAPLSANGIQQSLLLSALTLPAFALLRLNGSLANAQKRFELGFLPDLFVRPLLLLSFVVTLWLAWNNFDIKIVLAGHAVIATALALWQMYKVKIKKDRTAPSSRETKNAAVEDTSIWRRRAAPLILIALFISVFADLDIVVSRLFLSDAQTGIFGVCLKISLFVAFGIQVLHQMIQRDIADGLHKSDKNQIHKTMARANAPAVVGAIAATIVVVMFGRELLSLFGDEFVSGYTSLVILMLAIVVRAIAGPAAQVLALGGQEKSCLPVFAVCMSLLVIGNFVLINWLGLAGAAVTVLIVSAVWSVWLAAIAKKKFDLNTSAIFA